MSNNFFQNAFLRSRLLESYRLYARAYPFAHGPKAVITSIPKAGTHLVTSQLAQLTGIFNSRLHIGMDSVNKLASLPKRSYQVEIDTDAFTGQLAALRNGQFATTHLFHDRGLTDALRKKSIASIFLVRDPRDIILSEVHYVRALRRHDIHHAMWAHSSDFAEQTLWLIRGSRNIPYVRDFKYRLESYAGWLKDGYTTTVRYEDLVGARGGGSDAARDIAIKSIVETIGIPSKKGISSLQMKRTPTLRKGRIGGWRDEMAERVLKELQATCGEAALALGYDLRD